MTERLAIASLDSNARRNVPPEEIRIAKGMKIMVTLNIETEMDVANGTRGEIVDILLASDKPPLTPGMRTVRLRKPPAYVLVKLPHTRMRQLPGLPPNVIPIEPRMDSFPIKLTRADKTPYTRQVRRRQLPLTAAYAFTDYRSQGQTIKNVIVDIAKPPGGNMTIFNLYVALSRSSGRDTIRLLRDFPDDLFQTPIPHELMEEDHRLRVLNAKTKAAHAEGKFR
ncbi:hypothetical protein QCA50_013643 [Cerrena zonata]|uniref:Uncharacterized protein n=1 Tax=Cerrena zonata TaxID=2478898 RepID=A0AAW0FR92_9APHY